MRKDVLSALCTFVGLRADWLKSEPTAVNSNEQQWGHELWSIEAASAHASSTDVACEILISMARTSSSELLHHGIRPLISSNLQKWTAGLSFHVCNHCSSSSPYPRFMHPRFIQHYEAARERKWRTPLSVPSLWALCIIFCFLLSPLLHLSA